MDPITHILMPALWTEPVPPPELQGARYARWRERAAVVLGALLPDADGAPGLLETFGLTAKPLYMEYHRGVLHSLPGLAAAAFLAAWVARAWPEKWLLPSLRTPAGLPVVKPRWSRLLAFSGIAVGWHLAGDAVTAWGTLKIFWPFSDMDIQLQRVNSIEPVLLAITLVAWGVQQFFLAQKHQKAAWWTAGCWLAAWVAYVWLRPYWGLPAFV